MQIHYWEYFLSIENDLAKTSQFVEFVQENYNTFSIEFAKIILSSSSEFDVIAKEICKIISPDSKVDNIDKYRKIILSRYPKFPEMKTIIPRYKLSLSPWHDWQKQKNPWWWKSYNNIKHQRSLHYNEATLATALNSVAGLLCGILYYYRLSEGERVSLLPSPLLFESKYYDVYEFPSITLDFNLPDTDP